jgi:hypothetical protein
MSQAFSHQLDVPRRGGVPWVFPVVLVLSLLGIASVGYAWSASARVKRAVANEDNAAYAALDKRLAETQQRMAQTEDTDAQLRGQLSVVAERLQLTPDEQAEAKRMADEIRKMNAEQLAKLNVALRSELSTKASDSELNAVSSKSSSEVADVRSDINNAKTQLQATLNEMNKLVERNQREIALLRSQGQRIDYEFVLDRKGAEKTISGVTIELKDANAKKNEFSLMLSFGKTLLVQKNRLLDEPIYFYLPGESSPVELVVTQLQKNHVAGRMTMSKTNAAVANTSTAASVAGPKQTP